MDKKTILEALEKRIFDARISVRQVCIKAGVSPMTITRWRENPDQMTAPTLGKLETALTELEAEHD